MGRNILLFGVLISAGLMVAEELGIVHCLVIMCMLPLLLVLGLPLVMLAIALLVWLCEKFWDCVWDVFQGGSTDERELKDESSKHEG